LTYGGIIEGAYSGVPPFKVIDAATRLGEDPDVTRIGGRLSGRSFRSLWKRLRLQWRTLRTAFALLESAHYDVIYVFDGHPLVLLVMVRLFGKRASQDGTVLVLNLYYPQRLSQRRGPRWFLGDWLYRKALLGLLRQGRVGLRVMDQPFKEALIDRLKLKPPLWQRIGVVPHGIDSFDGSESRMDARKRLGLSPDETIFLFFGVLRKDKRYDNVIQAMRGLSSCRLVIAGPPLDISEHNLRDLIRLHGCELSVSLDIRFIDDARLRDYFVASDVVMVSYGKSFTGSSGVLFQACTCSRCVIGSKGGPIGQIITEKGIGLTVEPENPEALRQAMLGFMRLSLEERMRMEERARALAQKESWDAICAQLEAFCSTLADR
jgi:glycosyltransferase involved in cell wall biosynthesis